MPILASTQITSEMVKNRHREGFQDGLHVKITLRFGVEEKHFVPSNITCSVPSTGGEEEYTQDI